MSDADWFKAFCLAVLGLFLGPLAAFGLACLISSWTWPTGGGDATVGAEMMFTFGLPFFVLSGLVVGPLLGFLWGIFGDTIYNRSCDVLTRVLRRISNRRE